MMLLRSASDSDVEAIYYLTQQSGVGITTIPKNKALLKTRLHWSTESFKKKIQQLGNEYYLFVLEDKDKIIGISAIEARTGSGSPFYSYKISKRTQICNSLNIHNEYDVLTLVSDNQDHSELCTLFLEEKYRKAHNGSLLSKGRLLFMAQHSDRFKGTVLAELRGYSDEQGKSPFWDHVGKHFFHMTYAQADKLTLETNKQFISDLIGQNPIDVPLLPVEAQTVIGKPHPKTLPAMSMLLKEGFSYNNYVDVFDAGPTIEAVFSEIKTINLSKIMTIKGLNQGIHGPDFLLANTSTDFRATVNCALINEGNSCFISKETAHLLKVKIGDNLCLAPLTH